MTESFPTRYILASPPPRLTLENQSGNGPSPVGLDTWKFLKGQEVGEQVNKICRSVGQCILGLQVRLVSAPPRHRGQPAGPRRDWIHKGPGWAGWPGWGWLLWEEKDNSKAHEKCYQLAGQDSCYRQLAA